MISFSAVCNRLKNSSVFMLKVCSFFDDDESYQLRLLGDCVGDALLCNFKKGPKLHFKLKTNIFQSEYLLWYRMA